MSQANSLWGAPRIHGELLKLGVNASQATVAKYMARRRRPPSQTCRTFLANHLGQIAAADFFVVPTATCRLLFVLVILAHERRRVVHVAITTIRRSVCGQLRPFDERRAMHWLLANAPNVTAPRRIG
jgi:putative transposase